MEALPGEHADHAVEDPGLKTIERGVLPGVTTPHAQVRSLLDDLENLPNARRVDLRIGRQRDDQLRPRLAETDAQRCGLAERPAQNDDLDPSMEIAQRPETRHQPRLTAIDHHDQLERPAQLLQRLDVKPELFFELLGLLRNRYDDRKLRVSMCGIHPIDPSPRHGLR